MTETTKHFIEQRIEDDIAKHTYASGITTRFPPEPNGYLHIGHVKSICLNFLMAKQYQGRCHLRFDDTNPTKEEVKFTEAIKSDVSWLGFKWDSLHFASDYFEQLYDYAVEFIKQGHAYVCSLSGDQIREYRGTLTEPGKNSPYRDRSIDENLDLFARMRAGEFAVGEHVLRAKIDMNSGNINMRDPIIYRILHAAHPHTGEKWCIYPMYDYAHCFSDAIEKITHSLCTLEFQDHRPLYDWFLEKIFNKPRPQQIEFSRLNVSHTITSKRKLKFLVENKLVAGWDDPRMSTIAGLRRRGFTPAALREFVKRVGISKNDSVTDMALLEECVRDDLNIHAKRAFCILNPLKITITNLTDDHIEKLPAPNHPQNPDLGMRELIFSKHLYIDHDDFMQDPPKKYHRLAPGQEVRLRFGYIIKCEEVISDPQTGKVLELKCSYDPATLGKNPEDRKVKGVIHWLAQEHSQTCQVRLYDRLFNSENPGSAASDEELISMLNPDSLQVIDHALTEANISYDSPTLHYQFERVGYFMLDQIDSQVGKLVFNRVVNLRDSWAKITQG